MKWVADVYYKKKNYDSENFWAVCNVEGAGSDEEAMVAAISKLRETEDIDFVNEARVSPIDEETVFTKYDTNFFDLVDSYEAVSPHPEKVSVGVESIEVTWYPHPANILTQEWN